MLIIALLKGVPARTTQVVEVGGVLNREAMDLVLNPHDAKAIEAADFLKRAVGGKVVALSMGPDMKLIPLMKPLYDAEVLGIDEEYVLSDRKMAGSDTLATSYAVSLGVQKLVERHAKPIDEISEIIKKTGYSDAVKARASELYRSNLLPNAVYSELPAVRDSIVQRFIEGSLTSEAAVRELEAVKESVRKFMIVSGIKTTDGETGSVGPQVAEGVSELLGTVLPHATYVEDFDIDPAGNSVTSQRMIGSLMQRLEMSLPALITVSTNYRPRQTRVSSLVDIRSNCYKGKVPAAVKWTADDLGADPKRLGLAGSPTIVGTGIDVGKPPVQKVVGTTLVFVKDVAAGDLNGAKYGPFARGDLAAGIPEALLSKFRSEGTVSPLGYDMMPGELFG